MNPDRVIAVSGIVAGITASFVGALALIALKLILGEIDKLGRRIGTIESVLIKKGLHEHAS